MSLVDNDLYGDKNDLPGNESFTLTEFTETLALEKTSSEQAIEEAAQDFVDSDENLNK